MTMPSTPVAPPQETPSLYGLFGAARLLSLSGHNEAGIVYDVVCDTTMKFWPGVCRPIPPGPPISRTITVEFIGRTGGETAYSIWARAFVDSGPVRQVRVDQAPVTTGGDDVEFLGSTGAGQHDVTITDIATGTSTTVTITQATDGSVTPASATLVVEDPSEAEKLAGESARRVEATPFVVYGVETCLLGLSFAEQVQRARARLALVEQPGVERAFWTGELGNTVALATSDPQILNETSGTPPQPTAVDIVTGLSLLEEWLGQQGSYIGFIHVNRAAAAVADEESIVRRNGSRLETALGNVWVFGSGYPRTGPTGQEAPTGRQMWMFATRQPTVRRSEVFTPAEASDGSALNYRTNQVWVAAERVYVVDVPCDTAAVLVDLDACRCGGTQ